MVSEIEILLNLSNIETIFSTNRTSYGFEVLSYNLECVVGTNVK